MFCLVEELLLSLVGLWGKKVYFGLGLVEGKCFIGSSGVGIRTVLTRFDMWLWFR